MAGLRDVADKALNAIGLNDSETIQQVLGQRMRPVTDAVARATGQPTFWDNIYARAIADETARANAPAAGAYITGRTDIKNQDVYNNPQLAQDRTRLSAYRADPTNRSGGKNGLETMPTKLNTWQMHDASKEMAAAAAFGVPQLSATALAAFALKEGRSDFGSNDLSRPSPAYMPLYERLAAAGFESALFLTKLKEKQDVATRLKIPFAEAWNGTGQALLEGKQGNMRGGATGAQYARDYENYIKAAAHPKNARLMQVIQSGIDAGRAPAQLGHATGGVVINHNNPAKRERLI